MESTEALLTVYFDDPFWVGVLERRQGNALTAARVVFGAEPRDCEVYAMILQRYYALPFSPAVQNSAAPNLPGNPKQRQRMAMKAVESTGTGTKAQQALAAMREAGKAAGRARRKEAREARDALVFALRQEKRRQKHRGH